MKVNVENDIFLASSGPGFTIERKTIIQSGKSAGTESYVAQGHYGTIQAAINGLVKLKISESTATTLKELLEEVKAIRHEIETKVLI